MAQTTGRLYDEFAKLMNDATGVAAGVRREFETVLRTQAERILRDLDVVQREDFEAVKEMARLAREENEALKARIAALEAKVGGPDARPGPAAFRRARRPTRCRYFPASADAFLAIGASDAISPPSAAPEHPWRLAAATAGFRLRRPRRLIHRTASERSPPSRMAPPLRLKED